MVQDPDYVEKVVEEVLKIVVKDTSVEKRESLVEDINAVVVSKNISTIPKFYHRLADLMIASYDELNERDYARLTTLIYTISDLVKHYAQDIENARLLYIPVKEV